MMIEAIKLADKNSPVNKEKLFLINWLCLIRYVIDQKNRDIMINRHMFAWTTTIKTGLNQLESIPDELEPGFCALSEYGLANYMSVFVRE
jgi:hypothetical protein